MIPRPLLIPVAAGLVIALCVPITSSAEPPATGGSTAVRMGGQIPLARLAERATAVVAGTVRATTPYDEDRLLVHHLHPEQTLFGRPLARDAPIVEIRGGVTRPPVLAPGARVVALLRPAPDLSYLATHLPPDEAHFDLVGGREGLIPVTTDADVDLIAELLEQGRAVEALPTGAERTAASRTLAFRELTTRRPRLVGDALLLLRRLPPDTELTTDEVSILSGIVRASSLHPGLRIAVLRLLADRKWGGADAVVSVATAEAPPVLRALLDARARLGVPADRKTLAAYLESDDPALRAAAVEALAALDDTESFDELGRYATSDDDPAVRTAAIEALGRSGKPEALPYLGRTFESDDRAVKQASARAMRAIGGEDGADALFELALSGKTPETRRYAALVLVLTHGGDHRTVTRLAAESTDPRVQELLQHGIEFTHSHGD